MRTSLVPLYSAMVSTFGERLRTARQNAGLSQTDLAADLMTPSYVSQMESGRRVPAGDLLEAIAQRLGTSAEYLRLGDQTPDEEIVRLQVAQAAIALADGNPAQARDELAAMDLSELTSSYRATAQRTLAAAHSALGNPEAAVTLLEQARAGQSPMASALFAADLVAAYREAGNLARAVSLGREMLAHVEALGLAGTDEHLLLGRAVMWTHYQRDDLQAATARAKDLADLAARYPRLRQRASVYRAASELARSRGDVIGARELAERAVLYMSLDVSAVDVHLLRTDYAWLLLRGSPPQPAAALVELDRSAAGLVGQGRADERSRVDIERSRAHLLLGHYEPAAALAQAALDAAGEAVSMRRCAALVMIGDVLAATGDRVGAHEHFTRARDLLGQVPASRMLSMLWAGLGLRFVDDDDFDSAARAYRTALTHAGVLPPVALAH